MNQNEFFNILMDGLKDFPESKLRDIISYYDNKFTHGLALGKTEEEIITELGNPNLIVNQYKNEFLDTADISTPFDAESSSYAEAKSSNTEKLNCEFSSDTIFTNSTDPIAKDNSITDNDNSNDIYTGSNISNMDNINEGDLNFTANDNFNNNNNDSNILMAHSNLNVDDLNNTNYSKPYSSIDSSNNFYDLHTKNQPVKNGESNYNNTTSNNENYNYSSSNTKSRNSHSTVNLILKFCIVAVTLLIFSPVITGIIGCIVGLLGVAISILVGSIGLLVGGTFTSLVGVPNVPMFVANFPYPVIVLFSLGSISLSLFLTLVFYYLCKFFIKLLIKAYRVLKLKGGDL